MAKRDVAITSSSHAEDESPRPHLADEGSEATPPRNELPTTNLLPEVTEELDEFNTAREKALSDKSGDQQVSSVQEEVPVAPDTTTSTYPASPKSPSAPLDATPSESLRYENPNQVTDPLLLLCPDEKIDSSDKAEEQSQNRSEAGAEDVVSLGSSAEEITEKRSRKKRMMKKLGLGSSKRRKTSKSGVSKSTSKAPSTDELSPPVLVQNTYVSSRVRSRKASERSAAAEVSPVTERVQQFMRRSLIAERSVDMTEKDQWGYVEIIAKGSMGTTVSALGNYVEQVVAEFYAGLPDTKVEADAEEIAVQVRGHTYEFSPTMINEALHVEPLDEDEVEEETTLDSISKSELAEFLTEGTRKEWDNLTTADLSPRYGALMIIAAYNWIPSTHKTHVSVDRARLIYKMARGIRSTSKAPSTDELSPPVLAQNTFVSSRVRSRKASERSAAVEVSPVTERVQQFMRRSLIAERSVDMTEKDQWGYVEIIAKGSMGTTVSALGNYVEQVVAEFYAGLPDTKVEADAEEIAVQVCGHTYEFSPTMINETLHVEPLDEDEEWGNLTTADLSPRYGALMIITAYNWIPSTHKTHVSVDRARLIYKMARGIRVDMGRLIFRQVMNLGVVQKNDSRWLIFPRLIMSVLQKQHRVSLLPGEKAQGPVVYTKDKRVGEIYEQRLAKAKSKAKKGGEGKPSSRSARVSHPLPSSSSAPPPSTTTGPRRFSVHDLGSVSIPQGVLTHNDLHTVLQQTTRALQALTDIVQDLSRSVAGTCETQGLKRGRLNMYSQDGAVVVHEARHELRHQMRIQEAGRVS
ncbi:hypothetical protein F2Q68_00022429 [Brassica cretica]|uniref:Putative plant transposon protein domain-containing protein n=1 Tax=Brassica cretica TaxID=69181 RepID=A0A8S9FZY7_BRACR|nr:hypothetical protein F2Q68_00022429 [Brassica cretica]